MSGTNLHIYPSPIKHESRMLRMTAAARDLAIFDRIVLVGTMDRDTAPDERIDDRREIARLGTPHDGARRLLPRLLRFMAWYLDVLGRFRRAPVTCINCHSLSALPLSVLLKLFTGAKLIYEPHELETETLMTTGLRRALVKIVEWLFIGRADSLIVVGPAIADWYRTRYRGVRPVVVRNLPQAYGKDERPDLLRAALGIGASDMVFLYQGVFGEGRGIETILAAFAGSAPDRHVVFLGYGPLDALIDRSVRQHPNIHRLPAVAPAQLMAYTRSADIGLCLIEPVSLSYRLALPNKLFEYLAAGVPAIVTMLPDMSAVVEESGGGWITANDPDALRRLVGDVTLDETTERRRKALAWSATNTWHQETRALESVYGELGFLSRPGRIR